MCGCECGAVWIPSDRSSGAVTKPAETQLEQRETALQVFFWTCARLAE